MNRMTGPDDARSPWERDDWLPEPAASASDTPSSASPVTESPTPGSQNAPSRAQVVAAAGFAAVLLIVGVLALMRDDETSSPTSSDATSVASTARGTERPPSPPVTLPVAVGDDGAATVVAPSPGAAVSDPDVALPPDVAVVEDGRTARWTDWEIDVPTPLDAITVPTELVALSESGFLHRIEFPSGRVRSVFVDTAGGDGQVVVGADAIVVYGARLLTVLRGDGAPVEQIEVADGVIFVQEWPGTGRFIVTTAASSGDSPEQQFVLEPDGALVPAEGRAFDDDVFWARSFLPSGELVVNGPGGVYAIAPDQAVRRVSDGDLLATGTRHLALEECDVTLTCAQVIVDTSTGERVPASLAALVGNRFVDPSTRVSPDGRSVVASDNNRGTGIRQIIDAGTGDAIDIGRVDSIFYADTWAADSSGLFTDQAGLLRFHPREPGDVAVVGQLGRITSIGTRAVAGG
jgi:hypothetical protein